MSVSLRANTGAFSSATMRTISLPAAAATSGSSRAAVGKQRPQRRARALRIRFLRVGALGSRIRQRPVPSSVGFVSRLTARNGHFPRVARWARQRRPPPAPNKEVSGFGKALAEFGRQAAVSRSSNLADGHRPLRAELRADLRLHVEIALGQMG